MFALGKPGDATLQRGKGPKKVPALAYLLVHGHLSGAPIATLLSPLSRRWQFPVSDPAKKCVHARERVNVSACDNTSLPPLFANDTPLSFQRLFFFFFPRPTVITQFLAATQAWCVPKQRYRHASRPTLTASHSLILLHRVILVQTPLPLACAGGEQWKSTGRRTVTRCYGSWFHGLRLPQSALFEICRFPRVAQRSCVTPIRCRAGSGSTKKKMKKMKKKNRRRGRRRE